MAHRLNAILSSNRELSLLTHKARQLMLLQRQWEQVVPASMQRGCRVLHLEQQTLTLAADNGAIAAKLRQMSGELSARLRTAGCEVTVIQVQVQVSAPAYVPPPKPHALSAFGKDQLEGLASKLDESPLKAALQRLVKRD